MWFYGMRKIWNTALFQGAGKRRRYFEGWYFKHVSKNGRVYAIIPGIALSADGRKKHAFIQTIDGNTVDTHYVTFPFEAFAYSKDSFQINIDNNRFSTAGMQVDIRDGDYRLNGECVYDGARSLPFSLINPNAMGWYSFVPFMECYHGLVSMDHSVQGYLETEEERIDFNGGRGYIEKDWGRSFPSSWIWMQTNTFSTKGDSFMLSIARIPWLGKHFIGFLGFVTVSGKVHKFATYTGARLTSLDISDMSVNVVIQSGSRIIEITGRKKRKGLLQAPVNGVMERRISESIDADITVGISDRNGSKLFRDTGALGGLEIVGDPQELASGVRS